MLLGAPWKLFLSTARCPSCSTNALVPPFMTAPWARDPRDPVGDILAALMHHMGDPALVVPPSRGTCGFPVSGSRSVVPRLASASRPHVDFEAIPRAPCLDPLQEACPQHFHHPGNGFGLAMAEREGGQGPRILRKMIAGHSGGPETPAGWRCASAAVSVRSRHSPSLPRLTCRKKGTPPQSDCVFHADLSAVVRVIDLHGPPFLLVNPTATCRFFGFGVPPHTQEGFGIGSAPREMGFRRWIPVAGISIYNKPAQASAHPDPRRIRRASAPV